MRMVQERRVLGGRVLKRADLILAAFSLVVWAVSSAGWFRGIRSIPVLKDVGDTRNLEGLPSLSVVVPARDEERTVAEGVESVLTQDYPDFEVIAVNDRSTDRTGEILEELKTKHPALKVLHVEDLPEGWLGKNHALYLGAAEARGEWVLFTDADVRFAPGCLRKAMAYVAKNGLDHLTLQPEIVSRGTLLKSFVAAFELIFTMSQRPWRAGDPQAKEHVGVGAFNLVRREAYLEMGTHRAIAMRPDDDMKLAKLVKKHGFRQGVALGTGLVIVEWHQTVGGAVRGLSKSIFPGVDYRLDTIALGAPLLFLTNVLPFVGAVFAGGAARVLFGANVVLTFALYAYRTRHSGSGLPLWYAALHPLGVSFFIYAMLRSTYTTLANDGIEWRGTKYPLGLLRENTV